MVVDSSVYYMFLNMSANSSEIMKGLNYSNIYPSLLYIVDYIPQTFFVIRLPLLNVYPHSSNVVGRFLGGKRGMLSGVSMKDNSHLRRIIL